MDKSSEKQIDRISKESPSIILIKKKDEPLSLKSKTLKPTMAQSSCCRGERA